MTLAREHLITFDKEYKNKTILIGLNEITTAMTLDTIRVLYRIKLFSLSIRYPLFGDKHNHYHYHREVFLQVGNLWNNFKINSTESNIKSSINNK